jgi:hypothetical protein
VTSGQETSLQIPDITGGMPAIDHHSHASVSRFRTVRQIEEHFATAHMEANVPAEVYDAFIAARNKGDAQAQAQLEAEHGTQTLLDEGLLFRSTTFFADAAACTGRRPTGKRRCAPRRNGVRAARRSRMTPPPTWQTPPSS